ncbi:MAG TPA: MBOAT family protein [Oscillospiraceae bacterium]|nr:MBOAT family protein [Oscillospiraceae bacterium]
MVFSSIVFLFEYLPVVLAVYYLVPAKWRNVWLFAANMVFYGWGEPVYILLMLFSIGINYAAGLLVGKYRGCARKKARTALGVNIAANLALLIFFKYFDLLAETLSLIPGVAIPKLGLGLPIGISFYTFQAMSYPIDVYRGDTEPQRNPLLFGTYISLFPQLIAGPIVRYKDVDDQLQSRVHSTEKFASGVCRFTIGLGKKVLIANNVGALWDVYAAKGAADLTVLGSWLGIIAFTLQIYFDFSGYSDMAIGLGRMLGFEFLENFNYPYISKSVTEFWRRWHISLSSWFRDYVYIPLGGNRKGLRRQLLNIVIVWALTGMWHGANWTFLVWGLYYALFLVLEKAFLLKVLERTPGVIRRLYTMLIVTCGWGIFQLNSLKAVAVYFKAMFGFGAGGLSDAGDLYYLAGYAAVLLAAALFSTDLLRRGWERLPQKVRGVLCPLGVCAILFLSTAYLVDSTYNPFLYFRF